MREHVIGGGFECAITDDRPGMVILNIGGADAESLFANEAGGHRWQRIPPTERGGRVHSSTITVAVFGLSGPAEKFSEDDVSFEFCRGHGPGGQKRNNTDSACRAIHRPTGTMVFIQTERSQKDNKRVAIAELSHRVAEAIRSAAASQQNGNRKTQIGRGERSDKVRTVQVQNGRVTNHLNGKKMNIESYLKGEIWKIQ